MIQDTWKPKKLVKTGFKSLGWWILMGLCLTGLLLSSNVFAVFVETIDDFDTYPVNTELKEGVGNWFFEPTDPMIVGSDEFFSFPHSAYFNWSAGYRQSRLDLRSYNTTDLAFKVYLKECPTGYPFFISFYDWDLTLFAGFQNVEMVGGECEIVGYTATGHQVVGYVPLNTWTTWVFQQAKPLEITWVRYSVNGGDNFSDFFEIYNGDFRDIDVFFISGNANNVFYVDDIEDGLIWTEPPIPPDQEWEIPELDDCSLLSGVEKWLCEIKNDLIGVFMPSQEKVNNLYLTISAFKSRFPFNYVESLKTFFTNVSEDLDQEKAIPIKILGQESEVDFIIWDQETVIGGVPETLKNVLFDFTTLIILMGFFVWLLSLIKRFFSF